MAKEMRRAWAAHPGARKCPMSLLGHSTAGLSCGHNEAQTARMHQRTSVTRGPPHLKMGLHGSKWLTHFFS